MANEDRLDAAEDADAMFEMNDEVARFDRQRIDGNTGHVLARASNAALATEDLVVREDAQTGLHVARRQDEPAIQHANGQMRGRWRVLAVVQQLVEPLALSLVIAQDDRR